MLKPNSRVPMQNANTYAMHVHAGSNILSEWYLSCKLWKGSKLIPDETSWA